MVVVEDHRRGSSWSRREKIVDREGGTFAIEGRSASVRFFQGTRSDVPSRKIVESRAKADDGTMERCSAGSAVGDTHVFFSSPLLVDEHVAFKGK